MYYDGISGEIEPVRLAKVFFVTPLAGELLVIIGRLLEAREDEVLPAALLATDPLGSIVGISFLE